MGAFIIYSKYVFKNLFLNIKVIKFLIFLNINLKHLNII